MKYEYFEKLLKSKNKRPADLTKITGIGSGTFSDWKNGKSEPKIDKLYLIAQALDVTLDELYTGKKSENYISHEEKELLDVYWQLNAAGRAQFLLQGQLLLNMASFTQKNSVSEQTDRTA